MIGLAGLLAVTGVTALLVVVGGESSVISYGDKNGPAPGGLAD